MLTAKCPGCGADLQGTLESIKSHIKACSRKRTGPRRSCPSQVAPIKSAGGIPELPYVIRVPIRVESQNKSQYAHWSVYATYRDRWYRGIVPFLGPLRGLRLSWSRWSVERVYTGRSREMDYGNLVGGLKPLSDALTRNAVILDDRPSCFKCEYLQRRGDAEVVVITLWEASDATPE